MQITGPTRRAIEDEFGPLNAREVIYYEMGCRAAEAADNAGWP